jgi:chemotaxis protein MotB
MSRKHDDEEHEKESSERWLLTYSDMITLLLVLFIMMYTISKVDTQKFNALAESLGIVMNPNGEVGSAGSGDSSSADAALADAGYTVSQSTPEPEASTAASATAAVSFDDDKLLSKIQSFITTDGLSAYVSVHSEERGVVVSLVEGLLFSSGSADINDSAISTLAELTGVIKTVDNYIRVEGSTDNVPIHSALYESNWELASQRAINVAKLMVDQGVDASRLSAVSYGEYRPVAPNDSEDNKQLNRRVDIVFLDTSLNVYEPETAANSN